MRALLLMVLVTSACGTNLLGPDFGAGLDHFGGCGDVVFFAVDSEDQVMVTFQAEGLVAVALASGTETSTVVDFPTDDADLVVEQGTRLSDATCDDVVENGGPRVERTWHATSGRGTVRVRPLGTSGLPRADLILEDVVFMSDGGDRVALEHLEWLDVSVGWYPG